MKYLKNNIYYIYKIIIKYIFNIYYIYLFIIYLISLVLLINCSSIQGKRYISSTQKIVFQEKMTAKGYGSERISEILRESIRSGLLEEGIRAISAEEKVLDPKLFSNTGLDSLALFRSNQVHLVNKKYEKEEGEDFKSARDFTLEGNLFNIQESDTSALFLYLILKNSKGEILEYYNINRQYNSISTLFEMGREIGKNISKEVLK